MGLMFFDKENRDVGEAEFIQAFSLNPSIKLYMFCIDHLSTLRMNEVQLHILICMNCPNIILSKETRLIRMHPV